MTKEEQQAEVVKAMPEVFAYDLEFEGGNFIYRGIGKIEHATSMSWPCYLSPAQHAAWIEKCLKDWLRDRGYSVVEKKDGLWKWEGGSSCQSHHTKWEALYTARKHWLNAQLKPKTTKEKIEKILVTRGHKFSAVYEEIMATLEGE